MISVVLADDQELVRAGLRALLENSPDIRVTGEAADGAAAVSVARRARPDIVLMDVRMPGVNGLEATRQIAADPDLQTVRVIVLTLFGEDEYVFAAIRAGASGFLLKDCDASSLRAGVRTVADGHALLSPQVTRQVMAAASRQLPRPPAWMQHLTPRERDVLREVARGWSNDEIGQRLSISPATARTYVSRLLARLGARDRSQLVRYAYEAGLVEPGADVDG
jgi:DNA-binding NarL/FixJ family response regulator